MKVIFTPASKRAGLIAPKPEKAIDFMPEWFKNIPLHEPGYNGNKMSNHAPSGTSFTVKGCSPFLDTFMTGYIFQLAVDVEFRWNEEGAFLPDWMVEDYRPIELQAKYQAEGLPMIPNGSDLIYKFASGWKMETPKGFSTLFTHPLNRDDLPFRTFSGVVETDRYKLPTEFPFQLSVPDGATSLTLKKGTPICQAIPFKREDWVSEVKEFNEEEDIVNRYNLKSIIGRSYKKQFWVRKNFE